MSYPIITTLLPKQVLTGDNYSEWKTSTNLLLTCFNYQFVLTEKCPPNPGSESSEIVLEAYSRWINANNAVRIYLLAYMSESLRTKHEKLETAFEIMESLEKMFSQQRFESCLEAVRAIAHSRMGPGKSVRAHVLNMIRHISVGGSNGVPMDGATQVRMILETLPSDFDPFKLDYALNKKLYDTTELLHELEAFESLNCGKNCLPIGAKSSSSTENNKKRKFDGEDGSNNPSQKDENEEKSKLVQKSAKGKCFHCGENGHWKRNCKKYLAELNEKRKIGNFCTLVAKMCEEEASV